MPILSAQPSYILLGPLVVTSINYSLLRKNSVRWKNRKPLKTSTQLEFCGISNNNAKKLPSSNKESIQKNYKLSTGVFYEQEIIPHA